MNISNKISMCARSRHMLSLKEVWLVTLFSYWEHYSALLASWQCYAYWGKGKGEMQRLRSLLHSLPMQDCSLYPSGSPRCLITHRMELLRRPPAIPVTGQALLRSEGSGHGTLDIPYLQKDRFRCYWKLERT